MNDDLINGDDLLDDDDYSDDDGEFGEFELVDENSIEGCILTCAARVGQGIEDKERYFEIMDLAAGRCAHKGLFRAAVKIGKSIADPAFRAQVLTSIIRACDEFEENDLAEELLEEVEDLTVGPNGEGTKKLAEAYAEAGKFTDAFYIAHDLGDGGETFSEVAFMCADSGDDSYDLPGMAHYIRDAALRADYLTGLALRGYCFEEDDTEEPQSLLAEAEEVAEKIKITHERIDTLLDIASAYGELGNRERRIEILSRAFKLCDEVDSKAYHGPSKIKAKDAALATVASQFAEIEGFDMAECAIEEICDPYLSAAARLELAINFWDAGLREKGLHLMYGVFDVACDEDIYTEDAKISREELFSGLATAFALIGLEKESLSAAGFIKEVDRRDEALRGIAKVFAYVGKIDTATEAACRIESAYHKVNCKLAISDVLFKASRKKLAASTLQQALADAEMLEAADEKARALMSIARTFAERGKEARASELFVTALETIALIKDSFHKAHALTVLDIDYSMAGMIPGYREEIIMQKIAPE